VAKPTKDVRPPASASRQPPTVSREQRGFGLAIAVRGGAESLFPGGNHKCPARQLRA